MVTLHQTGELTHLKYRCDLVCIKCKKSCHSQCICRRNIIAENVSLCVFFCRAHMRVSISDWALINLLFLPIMLINSQKMVPAEHYHFTVKLTLGYKMSSFYHFILVDNNGYS